ncbi:hypothetical protein LXL04_008704 [Taraxacum kok-saghyz]
MKDYLPKSPHSSLLNDWAEKTKTTPGAKRSKKLRKKKREGAAANSNTLQQTKTGDPKKAHQIDETLKFNSIEAFTQTLVPKSSEKRNEKALIYLIRFQFTKYRLKPAPAPEPIPVPALTGGSVFGTISGDLSGSVLQPVRDGSGRDGPNAHPYANLWK